MPTVRVLLLASLLLLPGRLMAQTDNTGPLRVFLDCSFYCDFDFVRTEIDFVDWVRDRADAHVHVLGTAQPTGSGGRSHELTFIGLQQYAGRRDTLSFNTPPAATRDETRRLLTQRLKLGIVPFLGSSELADRLQITLEADADTTPRVSATEDDAWRNWIFNVSANGFGNGEASFSGFNVFGSVSANRITPAWKIRLSANNRYSEDSYTLTDSTEITSIQRSYGANSLIVRSLGPNLSAGVQASASSATFGNNDLTLRFAPAVEYNLFPYSESTRRQLTALYTVGVNRVRYEEETIYDKLDETLVRHTLTLALGLRQQWGSINVSAEGAQYVHDLDRRRAVLSGSTDLRIFKGLSFNIGGNFEWISDQLSLPKADASDDEVLLRQRQLATDFGYFMHFGIRYSFGTRSNNVVNPRFDGTSGGSGMIFF
jgi:hypothetical protein